MRKERGELKESGGEGSEEGTSMPNTRRCTRSYSASGRQSTLNDAWGACNNAK